MTDEEYTRLVDGMVGRFTQPRPSQNEVAHLLELLTALQRVVLQLRYGLDGKTPSTYKVISETLSITRERARQLEFGALYRMRDYYRSRVDTLHTHIHTVTEAMYNTELQQWREIGQHLATHGVIDRKYTAVHTQALVRDHVCTWCLESAPRDRPVIHTPNCLAHKARVLLELETDHVERTNTR